MIQDVYPREAARWATCPNKFRSGTPAIGGGRGYGAALGPLNAIGLDRIQAGEQTLTGRLFRSALQAIEGLKILRPHLRQQPDRGAPLAASAVEVCNANDLLGLLDASGICNLAKWPTTCIPAPLQPPLRLVHRPGPALAFHHTFEEIDRFRRRTRKQRGFF